MAVVLIQGPAMEPVTLAEAKSQCGYSPLQDADHVQGDLLSERLRRLIRVARAKCENDTRRVFITQTYRVLLDGWPELSEMYADGRWYPTLKLPTPPFQSVTSFFYTDTQGNQQDMATYGYRVDPGSETQVARLTPPYAAPWPPLRMVMNNVQVTMKCGYGGPVSVSTSNASAVLGGSARWNLGDVGQAISVPGAGSAGDPLVSSIASVDGSGIATLADSAAAAVTNVTAYAGKQVPDELKQAILFLVQFYDENGAVADMPVPRVVKDLLDPYRNYVS
jgi:uncharacterized phiE125 gp8 family phage protein